MSRAIAFECAGERLHGVLEQPAAANATAVLIPVGGPQYRIGSHRQFVAIGRALSAVGYASLRFDYRGMGDSGGAARDFEAVGGDLDAALGALLGAVPEARRVVVWGLCDAAAAAVLHLATDPRVAGLVLVNPWARTDALQSRAVLTGYYGGRARSGAAWRRLLIDPARLLSASASVVRAALVALPLPARIGRRATGGPEALPARLLEGLERFRGETLIIVSGEDLTAAEFVAATRSSRRWRRRVARPDVSWQRLEGANHTFSTRLWRQQVCDWTIEWLQQRQPRAS